MSAVLEYDDTAWLQDPRRACRGIPRQVFFPEDDDARRFIALGICKRCPDDIAEHCLNWALEREEFGIWGRTSERQRKKILRIRKGR